MNYSEYKKKKKDGTLTDETKSSKTGMSYSEYKSYYKNEEDINEKLKKFFDDYSSLIDSAQKDFEGLNYGNASSKKDYYSTSASDLRKRATDLKVHINSQKENMAKEDYDKLVSYFNSIEMNLNQVEGNYKKVSDNYSQWDTEEDYNNAIKAQKDYEALTTFDLKAGKKEIAELESELAKMPTANWDTRGNAGQENSKSIADARKKLEAKIAEKKAYYNTAKRTQEALRLSNDALNAVDFEKFSQSGLSISYDDIGEKGRIGGAGKARTVSTIDKNRAAAIALYEHQGNETPDEYSQYELVDKYRLMKDEEFSIYSYYLGYDKKNGTSKAAEYIDSIEETLNYRQAAEKFEGLEDNTFKELLFGVEAGLDQFASGMVNLFNTEDDYLVPSSTQILSGMVREDLADDSIPMWYNFKEGKWEDKVLGSSLGQGAYDLTTTTSNMLPSILTSTAIGFINPVAGQIVGAGLMGASASGNAYAEMLNLGYDKGQARLYSGLVGASEATLQYLLGGIGKLGGGKLTTEAVVKIANNMDNAFARVAVKLGANALGEFTEEYLQDVLNPVFKNMTLGTNEEVNLFTAEALYSGILGALSAGILEGGSTIASDIQTTKLGEKVQKIDGGVERLKKLGTTFSADSVAYQIADKVTEETGAYKIGLLLQEAGATLSEQNVSDIVRELTNKGMTESSAKRIARSYQAFLNEEMNLTDEQVEVLEGLEPLADVLRKSIIGKNTSIYQRTREYDDLVKLAAETQSTPTATQPTAQTDTEVTPQTIAPYSNEYIDTVAKEFEAIGMPAEQAKIMAQKTLSTSTEGKSSSTENNLVESEYEVSAEGKTINKNTDKIVSIKNIAEISKSGEANLTLDDGTVVKASDLAYGSDAEALFVENISKVKVGKNPISTTSANALYLHAMKALENNPDMTADTADSLIRGLIESYTYGTYNLGMTKLTERNENGTSKLFAGELTQEQRNVAYELGTQDSANKFDAEQKAVKETVNKANTQSKKTHLGKVVFEGEARNVKGLNKVQRANLEGIKLLAELTNYEIHVFKSDANLKYTAPDGTVKSANGWYVTGTNQIWIDLNSGELGEGTMLWTSAHEIAHDLRRKTPKQWKAMADLILDTFAQNNVDTEAMLSKQIAKIKRRYRNNKSAMPSESVILDMAYEELVCDALSDMFTDGSIVNFMAEVKAKDRNLWQKIMDAIKSLLDKWGLVIEAYKGRSLETREAQALSQFEDVFKQLQEMYRDALMEANEITAAIDSRNITETKNTTFEGDVKLQTRNVNGNQVVWIEQNILKENKGLPVHQFIANFIAEHIGDVYTIIESGQKVYIGEDLPSEYTQSKYTKKLLQNNPNIIKAKNKASANLGEMIEIATNRRWEKTKHIETKDAKYGMYRYDTRFGLPIMNANGEVVGANVYNAELVIRNASDGKKYLYDIVGIKKDIASSDWLSKKTTSAAEKSVGQKNNISKDSITPTSKKSQEKIYSERDTDTYTRIQEMQTEVNQLSRKIGEIESNKDFKAQLDSIFSSNDDMNIKISKYQKLLEETEYGKLKNKRDALQIELKNLRKSFEEERVDKALAEEQNAIAESGLSEADYFRKQAVKEFGYTPYFYDAGYIVPNGRMLNFSGEKGKHFGSRGEDHRAIGIIYATSQGTVALTRFMNDGNIRIMAESPGIDVFSQTEPSTEQYSTIRKFISEYSKKGYFSVDISDENGKVVGSLEYENNINPTRIINDIKHYYATGEIRQQSNVSKFLYSERDSAYMDAVNNGNMKAAQKMVDDYAIKQGFAVDKDGTPDLLFHGTDSFGFTKIDTSKSDDGTTFWATPNMGVAGSYYEGSNYKVREIGKDKVAPKGKKLGYNNSMESIINTAKPFSSDLNMDLSKVKYVKESDVMKKAKKPIQKAVLASKVVLNGNHNNDVKKIAENIIRASEQGTYDEWAKVINQDKWQRYSDTTGVDFWEIDLEDNFNIDKSDISKVTQVDPNVFKMMYHIGDVLNALGKDDFAKLNGETIDKSDIAISYNDFVAEKGIYGFYHKQNNPFVYDCMDSAWDKIKTPNEAKGYFSKDTITTRQLAQWAFDNGYDAIKLDNVIDVGGYALKEARGSNTVWAFKNPSEQVKSADTITYDDKGNVIPLSQRFNAENEDIRFSDRDLAPTFYSQMGKVVEGVKQEKLAANSVVNLLRGKGVKAEEIRWSGIVPFLEGKKSVTKQELLDFINSSMLQIGEQMSDAVNVEVISEDGDNYIVRDKETRETLDEWEWSDDVEDGLEGWVNQEGEIALTVNEIEEKSFGEFSSTRWFDYKLDGGTNYREIIFTMPNSSYSNQMMRTHWGEDAEGVLAHARIQDFDVNGKKMLFIEEIQSDWHNAGHKEGYEADITDEERAEFIKLKKDITSLKEQHEKIHNEKMSLDVARFREEKISADEYFEKATVLNNKLEKITAKLNRTINKRGKIGDKIRKAAPNAPFSNTYHEFVLKRLLRMAAEQGYDSIGWTPAEIQVERWSKEFAEGYRIEYDQDMPKFLRKYGKQWGANVYKTKVTTRELSAEEEMELAFVDDMMSEFERDFTRGNVEIWSMDLTDSMKNSVLYDGQALYSERDPEASNRAILANALEGAAQNDIEKNKLAQYKEKISLIESEEKRLSEIQKQLFTKGGVEPENRKALQFEAKQIANRINTYDRQLLNLESTTALKNVLNREKALAMKRQKQKDNEALNKYKEKVAKTQRELLERHQESRKNAIDSRNKTAMRHKIKKVVGDLNTLLLKPSKERHVPEELRAAVAEALALVNMDTVAADERVAKYNELIAKTKDPDVIASLTETRDRILTQGNKLSEKLTKLKEAYENARDSADDSLNSMYDDVIYNKIKSVQEKVGNTPIRNMTFSQLESVYELYKMVLTTVRDSNKAFAENIKLTRDALGSNTFGEIKSSNKTRDTIKHQFLEKSLWQNLKPMQAMKTIGSGTLQNLWNNILYGQEVFAQDYDEAVKFAKETKDKHGYKNWDKDKLYSFESKSGKAMKLNLEQMMSIYAYSKRAQADEHIEYGGIVLNEGVRKIKDKWGKIVEVKVNDSTAYRLDKMQVGQIIETLEKEAPGAKAFVDEMQRYLSETMGEKGNEVSMKMYGIRLFKEDHYFPLKSSKDFMEAANAKLKGDVKIKNKGMTKSTVEHARNPIVLENFLDVWGNHINEMALYHGLVLPLEDFSRTLNYSFKADEKANTDAESVRTALHDAFGDNADNYLNNLLKAINGGVLHDSTAGFANKMISKFKKAKVMASLSVIVQQPTAIIRAMGIIEPKYFVAQNFNHKATWEELKKYCPTAIIKETGSFDTNMGRTIVDMIKDESSFVDKVGDTLGKAPAYMDEVGWNMIWRALKKKVATEQNLSGEALLQECGKQMTLILNETQVYDSVMSRNELMRSKDGLTKLATAFMAEPTTVANMIYGAALDIKRGKKGIASKTIAATIGSVVVNGLVSAMVYALRDDDDEKTLLEKYLSSATTEVLDGLNPLTYIPFVKDAYSIFQGYKVERADMSLIQDVYEAVNGFYNVLDPEAYEDMDKDEIAKHIYDNSVPLLTSICDVFGLPVGNILRDAEAIIMNDNLSISQTTGAGTLDALKEGVLGTMPKIVQKIIGTDSKQDKLYDAIVSGDATQINRLKSGYKDDKAYETAVRKALRDNDSRIKEAAEARIDGNIAEYTRIVKEIKAEGFFSQDTIVASVNAEINAINKGESSTTTNSSTENKSSSMYKIDDYYASIVGGDQASAYVVKEDIINTDVANGKDRDEAEDSFNSRFANYLREEYEEGYISTTEAQRMLVEYGDKSEDEAYSKTQYWAFKQEYPEYDDLSEESVTKYYEKVEPYGISVDVYYDYSKQKAKCKGTDNNGDGKTDSGSKKAEVLQVINSLPLTYAQKDALYYLNGWSAKTIYEAPWH